MASAWALQILVVHEIEAGQKHCDERSYHANKHRLGLQTNVGHNAVSRKAYRELSLASDEAAQPTPAACTPERRYAPTRARKNRTNDQTLALAACWQLPANDCMDRWSCRRLRHRRAWTASARLVR